MTRYIILLAVIIGFSSCASKFTKVMKNTDNEYRYKMAENYFVQKKYDKAQILIGELIPAYKGTAKFEDLYYKYAYCAYYLEDYSNAENLFKTFTENFPTS